VVVPNQAVQTGQDGTFVYVVGKDHSVIFRPVKVGPRIDTDMVIESGLEAGEMVVTEGQLRLQPGVTVQSKEEGTGGDSKGKRDKGSDSPTGNNGAPDDSKNPDGFKNKDSFKGKAPGGV
jgi:multidrug efflux system membrane fusion protein